MPEHVCPPDHKHGAASTCYGSHRCRCADCRRGHAETQRSLRKLHAYGRAPEQLISSQGTIRRLQALMYLGWTSELLGARLGRDPRGVRRQLFWPQVHPNTHRQVAALFDELWNMEPPATTAIERGQVTRMRNIARRRGYQPPLAWDDIDTDPEPQQGDGDAGIDMVAVEFAVSGQHVKLNPAERREALRRLHAFGLSDREISNRIGMAPDTALRIRRELDLPANYDHMGKIA